MNELELRNQEIVSTIILKDVSLQEVGKIYGLSRERVRQILADYSTKIGIPLKTARKRGDHKKTIICAYCGKKKLVSRCQAIRYKRHFCNMECYSKYGKVLVICDGCGKPFFKGRNFVNRSRKGGRYQGKHYHSRECFYDNHPWKKKAEIA